LKRGRESFLSIITVLMPGGKYTIPWGGGRESFLSIITVPMSRGKYLGEGAGTVHRFHVLPLNVLYELSPICDILW
jgi:hypothetical protein